MNKVILKIGGMSCSACSSHIEKYLNKQDGIINASVNLVLAEAIIEYDNSLNINDLEKFIKESGYKSLGIYNELDEVKNNKTELTKLIIYGVILIIVMYITMGHMIGLETIPFLDKNIYPVNYSICSFILTLIFLYYGKDILINGFKNLKNLSPNMDTLVMVGVLSSFIYSSFNMILILLGKNNYVNNLYFESVSTIIYFIKIGRYIDNNNKEKTKEAIKELVQITPKYAIIKTKDGEKNVTIDEIKKNDILICKPGEKIAVDGIIVNGETYIEQAFITGEAIPVKKKVNDKVIAGSINIDGYIEYKAEKIGKYSTISEIVRLVVESTNTKMKIARIADIVSSYFVPSIMIIAVLTFFIYLLLGNTLSSSITHFVTVLVVACPCSLGLATPLAIVVSGGKCAKNGIIVKSSEILERVKDVNTIVFDKTGTLTYGNLRISKIFNYSKYKNKDIIRLVSSIENKSNHPISKAFINYANENKIKLYEVNEFKNLNGIGLYARINNNDIYVGNNKLLKKLKIDNNYIKDEEYLTKSGSSIIYVIENNKVISLIGVNDIVRKNISKLISKLNSMNIETYMLTGDNLETANIIAKEIGINNVIANVLPNEKTKVINQLKEDGKVVIMVGDGINDAPSLASADIGISINSATDIAADSADVILINDNLFRIIDLINISKSTVKNIKQNLFWAFFYNCCMIPIAIGLVPNLNMSPMFASIAMTLSSFTVILNALRLKKIKIERND